MEKPCKLPKIENSTSSDNDINSKTRDFISELPDDVLYSILLKLPLRESVRTRVLSHRWKHVYAFPSILELNWLNMGQNHDFLEENEHPCRNCEEKFVRGVNQYLDFYKGGAGTKELELSNPKLLHFQCMTREAITVNLSAVPNLITLKHSVDSTGIRYVFTHVSQNHPMLRTLTVYSRCDWVCE
ncbi:F-box protein At1g80960-like isoform X2 [Jatropha curcas]|uniref:F-box protein At1g80960-like isoform X2 n=1 Tax=Jatropha curcas TaxID=180498 RepID=UPI00189511F6|nr:F-box protein At1g80960-like isoform X2 [Jatropha curcas]